MNVLSLIALVVATSLTASAMAADSPRRQGSSVASLPAPAATGPLRILLVDDDFSDNNHNPSDSRVSPSDAVFRKVVADAVGGNAKAWSIEAVKPYASGPGIERLRPFSVIVWYTAGIYGGNPDNTGVLSIEDEKTVRRYLQEVGGAVILMSPGYLSKVQGASGTWDKTDWPFLKEVLGIRGGIGLAQRFLPGTVTATGGRQFSVGKGGPVETQFSLVNPGGASVLFTTVPSTAKPGSQPAPVATANAYGKGRIVYVGFTFENLAEGDLAPAFQALLAAAGAQATPAMSISRQQPTAKRQEAGAPAVSAPEAEPATVQVSGSPAMAVVSWTVQTATVLNAQIGGAQQTTRSAQPKPAATHTPTVKVERLVPNGAPVALAVASPDASRANDTGPFPPGRAVTYRVTLTDAQGRVGFKEASFTPQAKDPQSLSAAPQADRTVLLTWPEVPGVTSYQVSGTTLAAPVTVSKATEWRSPPQAPGSQQWKVASVYEPGGVLTVASAWPAADSRVVPTPGRPFLSMPNGPGSIAESTAYYEKQCESRPGTNPLDKQRAGRTCPDAGWFLSVSSEWERSYMSGYGGGRIRPTWPTATFADLNDLGLGRRVHCAVVTATPRITICWATSHGQIPTSGQPPDANALASAADTSTGTRSLNIIITGPQGSFFGTWESAREIPYIAWSTENATGRDDLFADASSKRVMAVMDSQGPKSVPNACLSCHGGRYDATRKIVVGASLLPLIPAQLHFSSPQARADAEEQIRRINLIILESNPAPAIGAQIRALYNGTPQTPGTRANDAAVPAGWASQPGLYRQVIAPYCGTCHFSQTGPLHFGTFANLQSNKQLVQKAVCQDFSMPHSEQGFRKFWSEGGSVSLPGLLSTALGYPKCSQ